MVQAIFTLQVLFYLIGAKCLLSLLRVMARYSPTLQFLAYCTARAARKLFRCCMGRVSPPALTYAQFVQAWSEPAVIGQGGLASRGHYLPADLEVEPSSVDTILNHVSQQKRSLRQHLQTASDTILEKIGLVSSATNQVLARLTEQSALIGQRSSRLESQLLRAEVAIQDLADDTRQIQATLQALTRKIDTLLREVEQEQPGKKPNGDGGNNQGGGNSANPGGDTAGADRDQEGAEERKNDSPSTTDAATALNGPQMSANRSMNNVLLNSNTALELQEYLGPDYLAPEVEPPKPGQGSASLCCLPPICSQ